MSLIPIANPLFGKLDTKLVPISSSDPFRVYSLLKGKGKNAHIYTHLYLFTFCVERFKHSVHCLLHISSQRSFIISLVRVRLPLYVEVCKPIFYLYVTVANGCAFPPRQAQSPVKASGSTSFITKNIPYQH